VLLLLVLTAVAPNAAPQSARQVSPNSITVLNNVLDHIRDARHALDQCEPDKHGHHDMLSKLLTQAKDEAEASKSALLEEIKEYQAQHPK
jgi:hypothetical protein